MAKRLISSGAVSTYMRHRRTDNKGSFADNQRDARRFSQQASRGRWNDDGRFMSKGDRNAYSTLARAAAQNQRTDNYDYTKPSNYSHDARYRNIRRAFGMSAG